jgi:hypothetical protein
MLNLPVALMSALAKLTGKSNEVSRLCESLEVKTSSTVHGFEWVAPLSFEDSIRKFGLQVSKDGAR